MLGAVLAGGLGHRLGGSKATVALNRRPLISYPVEALWKALRSVVIVAKTDTVLPPMPGVSVCIEPDAPRHPLTGLVQALSVAGGRPVLVCPCDLPLVTPEVVRMLAKADAAGAPAVIACAAGRQQPLLGCYRPNALPVLAGALERPGIAVVDAVAELEPRVHELPDPQLLFNVNAPEDLLRASALLRARDQPNVKS